MSRWLSIREDHLIGFLAEFLNEKELEELFTFLEFYKEDKQ